MKIGLALGSGAARGWAHIGVIRALSEMGVTPDVVCGTSVGAVVGGAYLTGQLDDLQDWAKRVGLLGVLKLIDITFKRGGLVTVERAYEMFRNAATDVPVEGLSKPFGTIATDLATGREVWLREGPLLDVVRASAAMPGLFPAVRHKDMWLVDGALVNPVPVSLCRAMGADVVIAVNLNGDLSQLPRFSKAALGPVTVSLADKGEEAPATPDSPPHHNVLPAARPLAQFISRLGATVGERTKFLAAQLLAPKEPTPNVIEVMAGSIDIMQDRITRSRLAGEPPDVLLTPRIGHIGILDFDRAEELIELGRTATLAMRPAIELAVGGRG